MKQKTENKTEGCSLFEEMLMWTSYRYCIGRHSYVVTMANDIAKHYYNKLSDAQKQHASEDIRSTIFDTLRFHTPNLEIHRTYNQDEFNPIKALLTFIERENIQTAEEYFNYSKIIYHAHTDEYEAYNQKPTFKTFNSASDIEDLIPWENLASLFDIKNYKIAVLSDGSEVTVFPSWQRKHRVIETSPDEKFITYQDCPFGWEQIWRPVEKCSCGRFNFYVPKENIIEIKNIDNVQDN